MSDTVTIDISALPKPMQDFLNSLAVDGSDPKNDPAPIKATTKKTYIGLVLDSSGSMGSNKIETIGAYNAVVDEINKNRTLGGETYISLVTFGEHIGNVSVKYINQQTDAAKLDEATYHPSGNTPMYSGIWKTIEALKPFDVEGEDVAFLVHIFTDGWENASKLEDIQAVQKAIPELEKKGNWTFAFVGANVDLNAVSTTSGINLNNMISYESTRGGTQVMGQSVSAGVGAFMHARGSGLKSSLLYNTPEQDTNIQEKLLKAQKRPTSKVKIKPTP